MIQNRSIGRLGGAAVVVSVFALTALSLAAQIGAPRRTDLTGQWQLNRDLSDDARDKLQSMGHGSGNGARGGHGPGRHGGIFGIFGGGQADAEKMHAQLEEVLVDAPARFTLTQDDQKIVLTEADGEVRTLPTNNRKVNVDGRDVRTKWENDRLVSEITVGNARVIETYERSPNATQLIVTARVDVRGQRVSVRRVYDAIAR